MKRVPESGVPLPRLKEWVPWVGVFSERTLRRKAETGAIEAMRPSRRGLYIVPPHEVQRLYRENRFLERQSA